MNKTVCIGTKNLGKMGRVYCSIEIENGKLSISGVEGPLASGNALGGCGQIQDHLQPIQKFEPGWSDDLLAKFVDVWNAWHLNDMNAGCQHQRAMGWGTRKVKDGGLAGWIYEKDDPEGVLCKPCPECGYEYGTKWLKEELPADVIKFLESLPDSEYQPAWV